jgi:lysylphosphatidylglycerol synthetase-like protein (DUF2156 family)
MAVTTLVLLSVALVLVAFFIVAAIIAIRRKEKRPVDYYKLSIIGLIWLIIGVATMAHALWIIGLVFLIAGLANRKDWERNRQKSWHKLTREEQLLLMIGLAVLIAVLVVGLGIFMTYG